jgi:hypothetical protein
VTQFKIPRLLRNPKIRYSAHNSQSLVPILSQMNPLQNLTPISLRSILIISSHLRQSSKAVSSLQSLRSKFRIHFSTHPCMLHAPAKFRVLDLISLLYLARSKNCEVPPYASINLSVLGPNIFLSSLFSNNLSLFFLSVTRQVVHPHKVKSSIIVLYSYILIFTSLGSRWRDKNSERIETKPSKLKVSSGLLRNYEEIKFGGTLLSANSLVLELQGSISLISIFYYPYGGVLVVLLSFSDRNHNRLHHGLKGYVTSATGIVSLRKSSINQHNTKANHWKTFSDFTTCIPKIHYSRYLY